MNLLNFLYNLKTSPENQSYLMKHYLDLHNHFKNRTDYDIDGVKLCTEIQNIKQILISCLDISLNGYTFKCSSIYF